MKRCPECYEVYEDIEKFCELDGQPLLADPALGVSISSNSAVPRSRDAEIRPPEFTRPREVWFIGTAGVLLGVVVCVGGYLAYDLWNQDAGFKQAGTATLQSQTQEPTQSSRPAAAPRVEIAPPEEEAAPSESEESPEPATSPAEESDAVAAKLNQGPVSTGQRKTDVDDKEVQTIIQMNDGTAVEVDAAWEDGEGVWYRRGGMVAFVESQRVKAITGRAAQKPSSGSTQ